jgi:GMP synthase (glutamine-hydrolysing)
MMLDAQPTREAPLDGHGIDLARAEASEKKPVVMVLHQLHSNPGHIGNWFRRNGYAIDVRRRFAGDPLPETLEYHCGAVIFGGPQSANDNLDYIRQETDWIGVSLKEQKPFLGVCLGAQMLAKYLGAKVDYCCHGSVEIGYHRVQQLDQGRVLGALPDHVFQWHREGFDVPHGADLLASSKGAFPNQAFRYGPAAFGVQFHPEITHAQVNRWSGGNPVRLMMRGARPRHEQLSAHLTHGPRVHDWLDQFMKRWVDGRCGG